MRILLGTGSDDFLESLRSKLERQGCHIELAARSEDLFRLAQQRFDLILLDLRPADPESFGLLRTLAGRDASARCPVVLIKGEAEPPHTAQRGLDLGASGYLVRERLPEDLSIADLVDHGTGSFTGAPRSCRSPR